MSKEEKFEFDIANLKKDLAMEDMAVTDEDIEILKKYYNKELTIAEIINNIKKQAMQGV